MARVSRIYAFELLLVRRVLVEMNAPERELSVFDSVTKRMCEFMEKNIRNKRHQKQSLKVKMQRNGCSHLKDFHQSMIILNHFSK